MSPPRGPLEDISTSLSSPPLPLPLLPTATVSSPPQETTSQTSLLTSYEKQQPEPRSLLQPRAEAVPLKEEEMPVTTAPAHVEENPPPPTQLLQEDEPPQQTSSVPLMEGLQEEVIAQETVVESQMLEIPSATVEEEIVMDSGDAGVQLEGVEHVIQEEEQQLQQQQLQQQELQQQQLQQQQLHQQQQQFAEDPGMQTKIGLDVASYFELLKIMFCQHEDAKVTIPVLEQQVDLWQTEVDSKFAEVGQGPEDRDWLSLAIPAGINRWKDEIPSAVAFLIGAFPGGFSFEILSGFLQISSPLQLMLFHFI